MKVNRNIVIVMCILCILFLGAAMILEFTSLLSENGHHDFFVNLGMGLFTSGFLVLAPSLVQYINEKRRYYVTMYRTLNQILYDAISIIAIMNDYAKDGQVAQHFDSIKLHYNHVISEYSLFAKFFHMSRRDKLIDSVISETFKFLKLQEELALYRIDMKNDKITANEYKTAFDTMAKILADEYKPSFTAYQEMMDQDIKSLVKNKTFKKYY